MKWRTIKGFSAHQVSDTGKVRVNPTIKRSGYGNWKPSGSLMSQGLKGGYRVVTLRGDSRVKKTLKVHVLVSEAFCGPRPANHYALHKDDCKENNNSWNIYWGTKKQNAIDRSVNGKHGGAKLTITDALWIKELYFGDRRTYSELSEMFGVKPDAIRQVVKGKTFGWYKDVVQKQK